MFSILQSVPLHPKRPSTARSYHVNVKKEEPAYDYERLTRRAKLKATMTVVKISRKFENEQDRVRNAYAEMLLNDPVPPEIHESTAIQNPLRSAHVEAELTHKHHYPIETEYTHLANFPPTKPVTPRIVPRVRPERRILVEQAADAFDSRHKRNLLTAGRLEWSARHASGSTIRKEQALLRAQLEVRRNRYAEKEKAARVPSPRNVKKRVAVVIEEKKPEPWSLAKSIWNPRVKWCDSKDLHDTEMCSMLKFDSIWERACAIGMGNYIVKMDDDDDDGDIDDENNNGIPDEIEEVYATMSEKGARHLIFTLFDVYVGLGDDLTSMDFNEFCEFVRDFGLASAKSKHCKSVDLDRIFIAVDTATKNYEAKQPKTDKKQGDSSERTKSLSIAEFLYALVRIAAARFIHSGKETDVSAAVESLFHKMLKPKAIEHTRGSDAVAYRNRDCYVEEIDKVLRKHEKSLRNLFRCVATNSQFVPRSIRKDVGPMVTYTTWKLLVKSLGLLGADVSDREANQCFVAARMLVSDPYSDRGVHKSAGLPFEGLLEAFVRLAGIKGGCTGPTPAPHTW